MNTEADHTRDGVRFREEAGLPPYGPPAVSFPEGWGRVGQQGVVVRFDLNDSTHWIGNFQCGSASSSLVQIHPDQSRVLVFAAGNLWVVNPPARAAELCAEWIEAIWPVPGSQDLVLSLQGLALARLGTTGTRWRTRRLSWDGFDAIRVDSESITGVAWTPVGNEWLPFEVDLNSGASKGGSYVELDGTDQEQLAT